MRICGRCKSQDIGKPLRDDLVDQNIYKCFRCGNEGELVGITVIDREKPQFTCGSMIWSNSMMATTGYYFTGNV